MSYKSLLFCPDEKAARLVAQVLGELEFTVTLANDPQQTAQRLADEHFDAVVVDIANEQDATLLFKSARDSAVNHNALSVAVVEGQAGVAKAFRIGANLVLTKPINIEQSKGTLRVARGLLRKNETKAAPAATKPVSAPVPPAAVAVPAMPTFSAPPVPTSVLAQPAAKASDTPFSSLETEDEPAPAPEAAEAALLESMPDPSGTKAATVEQTWTPKLKGSAEPIAASTGSSAAAAVAPALEKPTVEIKPAAPMASHEPITADFGAKETFEAAAVPVPNFSYHQDSGASKKFIKTLVMLVLFGLAGYMGWQRFQLGQYLANLKGSSSTTADQDQPATDSSASVTAPKPNTKKQAPDGDSGLVFPETPTVPDDSMPPAAKSADRSPSSENIQVDDLSSTPEPKITVTAKPQPLVVKNGSKVVVAPKASQPAPPALSIANSSPASNDALANVVPSSAPLPTLKVLRVSQGVSQGLLVRKVPPVYPQAALQTRKQGSVELVASVGKDGSISTIKVLSGDPTLAKAATDAVKQWKYHPYLLNGEPVEIETQITVNFKAPE